MPVSVVDAKLAGLSTIESIVKRQVEGRLHLHFDVQTRGSTMRTVCRIREQCPPLQMVRAFPLEDGSTLAHLHNISGGILSGDHLKTTIDVGHGALAQLTTTGATRLYRSRTASQQAEQTTTAYVSGGGLLEYLPDPIIPFAGARYWQSTHITLENDAGLFWWEVIAPGRVAHGEAFAYERLQVQVVISVPERPLAYEHFTLVPQERPLDVMARLGIYRYLCTLYICRVGIEVARWSQLEEQLGMMADALSRPGECIWGVSSLVAHGLVVRALSRDGHDLSAGLLAFWTTAKRALYGSAAIPPRKVY
jgi:urease accessory protein